MKIKNTYLLFLAAIVWSIAGYNVLHIGLVEYVAYQNALNFVISIFIFVIFQGMVFSKLVKKHTLRIEGYKEKQFFLNFFDKPSFCIMAGMITFGLILRNIQAVPRVFIAVFYTGLGASLLCAGVLFLYQFMRHQRSMSECK